MPVKIFFCYAHEDEPLLNKLKTHLKPLQRMGLIDTWNDRDISAGMKWEEEINMHLNEANIILLLISPDFMNSDYCYGIEMQRALERDQRGEARVIPIILRPAYWQGLLGILQALPTDARPVMSSSWHYQDEAFYNVTEGIRKAVEEIILKSSVSSQFRHVQKMPQVLPPKSVLTIKPDEWTLISAIETGSEESLFPTFSPDGQLLTNFSGDGKIRLWQARTGQLLRAIEIGSEEGILPVFSPDGQLLAIPSTDGKTILCGKK